MITVKKMVKGVQSMNFHESADRDFSIQFCEYNYSNPDYDQIYRPNGSGD